jgi:hypothetical protein
MAMEKAVSKSGEIRPIIADWASSLKIVKQQGESLLYSFRRFYYCPIGLSANPDGERHRASFFIVIINDNKVKRPV